MPRLDARTLAEHRSQVLARLYRSFESLVDERGYDAVGLADVAQAAGMARTAIYHYFPDKEALLLAYTAHEMDEHLSDLRAALHGVDDPLDRLDAYVRVQLTYAATHRLPPGTDLQSVLSEDGHTSMRAHADVLEVTLSTILEEAVADGSIPATVLDDRHTLALVQGCIAAAPSRGRRGKALRALIASTQAFVRRSLGAPIG